jgi:prepilin-type processing-associated H-X9-DG protein
MIACASNMKQLGIGLLQYTQDNDDNLPPYVAPDGHQTWREAVYPFVKSTGVFRCPEDRDNPSNGTPEHLPQDYAANYIGAYNHDQGRGLFAAPGATPIMMTKLADPHTTLAFLEMRGYSGPEWNIVNSGFLPAKRRPWPFSSPAVREIYAHPGGRSSYAFADGHVKRMKPMDTLAPINLWTRDNSAFTGQDLANAQAILKHAQVE